MMQRKMPGSWPGFTEVCWSGMGADKGWTGNDENEKKNSRADGGSPAVLRLYGGSDLVGCETAGNFGGHYVCHGGRRKYKKPEAVAQLL